MDLRSSNSVAALALLIASGSIALSAPAVPAGERLEFSTPAIPLAVPHPDVEIKEHKKSTGSADMTAGVMGGVNLGSPQQIISTRSKSRDKYDLDSKDEFGLDAKDKYGLGSVDKYDLGTDPLPGEGQDKRGANAWLNAGMEPNRVTNGVSLNMTREWGEKDSNGLLQKKNDSPFEAGQNASRFDSPIGFERERAWDSEHNTQDSERYGRDNSNDRDSSFWGKTPNRDSSVVGRFNAEQSTSPQVDSVRFGFSAGEPRRTEPLPEAESTHSLGLPPGFGNFTPFDDKQSRQIGEQFGEQTGANPVLRAWEAPPPSRMPTRNGSIPGLNSATRVVAPNKPVNLPFPKRPDSPY
jgi:hypothetical protein